MKKSPFLIFAFVMTLLIGGVISFIQGPRFAGVVKNVIARYLPSDLGIEGDFSGLKVKLYPPGLAIINPRIRLLDHNIANLPAGSSINAERIDLVFRPVQMFSGNIRVHEVSVINGDVRLLLGSPGAPKKAKKKGLKPDFHWDELLQIHAEAIALRNTHLHIEADNPALTTDFTATELRVGQWRGKGGLGYEVQLDLNAVQGSFLKDLRIPQPVDHVAAIAHVNALGVQIDSLNIAAAGAELTANGAVHGNVLESHSLVLDATINAHGNLEHALEVAFKDAQARPEASGDVSFSGKIHASPERFVETVKAEGKLTGQKMKFQHWKADSLTADLGWQGAASGGELSVTRAQIMSHEEARIGGSHPGSGGKIDVGAFKYNFASAGSITVPLVLERVHLHWLAAPALKKVYGLNLRASGPVALSFRPKSAEHGWQLDARAGLDVIDLQLDNQRLGEDKPLHKIIAVPKIRVEGGISVDPTGFRPVDLTIAAGSTHFRGSGRMDFKSGFDLSFTGEADLADVGQIAENDVRGKGAMTVHVHGPSSTVYVDFDPDVKDAYYLKLKLGDLKGRITWDDDLNRIIFTRVQVAKNKSAYQGEGMIDLDKNKDTVELNIHVPTADVQDMIQVFGDLTQDLWWFPRDLTGPVHGDVKISGGISTDKLTVGARMAGSDWQLWGERFDLVELQGGFDRGKYQLTDFKATKRTGRIYGRVSLDADKVIDWGVHTEDFTIADFEHLVQLDVPVRGRILIESAGKGKEGAIASFTQAKLSDFAVRGQVMPPSYLAVRTEHGKAEVSGVALGGQGTLDSVYDSNPGGKSSLKGELKQLDFTPVLLLLNSRLIQDRSLAGNISGSMNLAFQAGELERATGKVDITSYNLAKTGTRFALSHPVSVRVSDGSFDLPDFSVRGNEGEATLALKGRRSALEGAVSGDIDVSIAEFFTSAITQAQGTSALDFTIDGTLRSPVIYGKAVFDGIGLRVPGLESPFENVGGTLQLRQNVVSVQNVQGDLAGGRVTGDGSIQLFKDRVPQVALKGALTGNKLKLFPFQFVKVHGDVEVHGDRLPYLVDGLVKIDSALCKEKFFGQKKSSGGPKALQYTPPPSGTHSSDYPKFKLNIGAVADNGIIIQNDLFDIEAKGRFTVVNTIEAPRILGTAELISGKLLFKDRNFQIQSASASFDNPTVINPSFSLAANTEINGTKIQMYVNGKLDNIKVDLSSNPVMPESEILSLLALGYTSGEAKRLSATDRSAFEQGEAASLLLHSLDFNREVQDKTGLQIQLDEAVNPQQQGTSVLKPQSTAESVAQPKIVIKRQIGKRFDLSYATTVGGSTSSAAKEINAEFHFTPGFSVMGVWDNYETVDTVERTSMGLDLKFQTRFK
jgi:hypothetical protein